MADGFDTPPWDLRNVALIVVSPTDELSFLQANPTAVHPSLTPHNTWITGFNWDNEVPSNARSSAGSKTDANIADAHPAVLLLRDLPKNGRTYIFGREYRNFKPDIVLPNHRVSRRQFCIYPNLSHRTWIIQDLSGKSATVNDCKVSSWRALQYDQLNRVVFTQTFNHPGVTLYIKLVWPEDSNYLSWAWQDPDTPELVGLNIDSTITSPTDMQSQNPHLQAASIPATYHVLERRLRDDAEVFYGQNLATAVMLAAEKFPSEPEARDQFSWRKGLKVRAAYRQVYSGTDQKQNSHFLHVDDLCLLNHSYILTECPHSAEPLADVISVEPLNDRAVYVLLQGVLSAVHDLFKNNIAHGAITSHNILVADLSPENPRLWLTGFSSARPMPGDKIKESHSADVDMVMRTIAEAHGGPEYLEDPVANAIFTGFLQALQSKSLSAKEVLDGFNTLTSGKADFPFKSGYLTKVFSLEQFRFGNQAYYRKTELAPIARALFAQNVERSQEACERILCAKPSRSLPGQVEEGLIHWEEAQKLFHRLGVVIGLWAEQKPKRKKQTHHMQELPIRIQLTYHAPSGMWNLSQLVNAVLPTSLLEIANPEHCVEVGGDAKSEGLYVDPSTFRHACHLLGVTPPESLESNLDPRANQFRSVNSRGGDFMLAEENLLGNAIFRRSSKTMLYNGIEYPEASVLQLFVQRNFESLHRGILQSGYPPQSMEQLCQGQQTEEYSESQLQSLTESQSEDSIAFTRRLRTHPNKSQKQPENLAEVWVNEQTQRKRRRYHPLAADIEPCTLVNGHLLPPEKATYSSPSCSTVLTAETPRAAPTPLTASDRDLRQRLEKYLGHPQ